MPAFHYMLEKPWNLLYLHIKNIFSAAFCFLHLSLFLQGPPSNAFLLIVLISWMVTLSSCLTWQIISFILPPNAYDCLCAWTTPAIDLQKMPILTKKNHLSTWSSFWSRRVCKQAKLSHLRHREPARIYWKADAPKTSHSLVRILVQRHNWSIFLRKWARRGCYNQWRSLSRHVERIFIHKTKVEEVDIGNIWFQQDGAVCHTVEITPDEHFGDIIETNFA